MSTSVNGQHVILVFPIMDTADCALEIELSSEYRKFIKMPIQDDTVFISKYYLGEHDTTFSIKIPDSLELPSIFITSEQLQPQKTPNPDSLSSAIVKQYLYYQVDIDSIEISPLKMKIAMVSKLSFKLKKTNTHFVNYSLFTNNRSVTIGLAHDDKKTIEKFNHIIIHSQKKCP